MYSTMKSAGKVFLEPILCFRTDNEPERMAWSQIQTNSRGLLERRRMVLFPEGSSGLGLVRSSMNGR